MTRSGGRSTVVPGDLADGGGDPVAVLALHGARVVELRRALRYAASLSNHVRKVAIDGGLLSFREAEVPPDLLIGDLDSVGRSPARRLPTIRFPRDKDYSDLAGGLREVARLGDRAVVVAGLVGGRLDHEWANLLELAAAAPGFAGIVAPTSRGRVVVTAVGADVATVPGKTLSLFALSADSVVSLRGPGWELKRRRLRPGSHGLSNVAGTELRLSVHTGVAALVLPPGSVARRRR